MRSVVFIFLLSSCALAQIIPGQYVVELQSAPMGAMARNREVSAAAQVRRAALNTEQQSARTMIQARGGKVLGSMRNVINAMAIQIPEENAAALSALPGVKHVFPVSIARPQLDHALPLHQVPQAWAQLGGMSKAGLGVKIGMLDTGITPGHPAFQDPTLTPPPGYPLVSGPENLAVVNNKIIVARNYAGLYQLTEPDSAIDRLGHGTETADCAAGVTAMGPFTTVTGVAPKAFLGIYKITPLDQGGASTAAIVAALDDAYSDGMDVVNISFSGSAELYGSLWDYALDRITRLGLVVVMSAGNGGPFPDTIGDGPDTDGVISVGASQNDRAFAGSVSVSGLPVIIAGTGSFTTLHKAVTAPLSDMAVVDPTNLGCGASLPAGSLTGTIVVTQTTTGCFFQTILNNAASAGAVGVILYSGNKAAARQNFSPLAATLPGVYVSHDDGVALKAAVNAAISTTVAATVTFEGVPIPNEARALASFSSRGPARVVNLKPDVTATGTYVYMATETANPAGELYHSSGYLQENGTSFASPIVAGSAALLKQARPGLTMDQYRSLLINSTNPLVNVNGSLEALQHTGAGVLNVKSALSSSIAVYPTSLSFGIGGASINYFDLMTVTNVGTQTETFSISSVPYDNTAPPTFSLDGGNVFLSKDGGPVSVSLAPKRSQVIYVGWVASGLATGEYQGQILVRGSGGSAALVPYWYAYPDGNPQFLNTLGVPTQATAGAQVGLYFKVKDATGTAVTNNAVLKVKSSVVTGNGKITGPVASTTYVNWLYMTATLSATPGDNTFTFQVQGFGPITYTITGTTPPHTNTTDLSLFSSPVNPLAVEGGSGPLQMQALQMQAVHQQ